MVLDHNSSSHSNYNNCFYNSTRLVSASLRSQRFRRDICAVLARIRLHKSVFPNEASDQNIFRKPRQYRTLCLEHRNEHSPHAHSWLNIILHSHRHWPDPNNPELAGFNRGFSHRSRWLETTRAKSTHHSTNSILLELPT